MALWHVLLLICFVMPLSGAVATAHELHLGWGWYLTGVIAGLALGTLCVGAMRLIGSKVVAMLGAEPKNWGFQALYLAAGVWIFIALLLGGWTLQALFHAFGG